MREIDMLNRRQRSGGFSLIKLLIAIAIAIILIIIMIAVPTIAVPRYGNTQKYMRETAAVAAILTIHKMQVQYRSQYGRYAASLTELGPPPGGAASPAGADLIGNDLARGERQGYKFTVTGNASGYVINANPITYGSSGNKSFYSDQSMVIRENYGPEPATASSKEIGMK